MKSLIQWAIGWGSLACIGLTGCGSSVDAENEQIAQEQAALSNEKLNDDDTGRADASPDASPRGGPIAQHLQPIINCVVSGARGEWVAYFGYSNPLDSAVRIPVGPRNTFLPPPFYRGQPTEFTPGESDNVVSVAFDGRRGPLVWKLGHARATAWKNSPPCVPSFAGVASATVLSDTEVTLTWLPATDYTTPSSDIVYDICSSMTPGECTTNFVVSQTSPPGASSAIVSGLTAGTTYFFVVRAHNAVGNEDTNTVEVAAQTCATGGRACNGTCTSLANDPANCGACGNQCLVGASCSASKCVNPPLVTDIAAGSAHTCVHVIAEQRSQVLCWGSNAYGQLGNGTTTDSSVPVDVPGLDTTVGHLVAGARHTCIKGLDGQVGCWGDNSRGQLGNGTTIGSSTVGALFLVPGSTGPGMLAAGGEHTCMLLQDGSVVCWGANGSGQLGNGTELDSLIPVAVSDWADESGGVPSVPQSDLRATSLAAGGVHTCVVLNTSAIQCWGWTSGSPLGPPHTIGSSTPVHVSSGGSRIAAGGYHTCASSNMGWLYCWGWNAYGQLGNGTMSSTMQPVSAVGVSLATAVAAGGAHSCVNEDPGVTKCWGNNSKGQLGDGTNNDSSVPVVVPGMGKAIKLAAGGGHTCALLQGGLVYCWGNNDHGQLGNGTTTDSSTPVAVRW